MIVKTLFEWIYKKVTNYNLSMLDENDYDENHTFTDPATVVKHDITHDTFTKLSSISGENVSCPCTTVTILLEIFVSNDLVMHPICQSIIFVDNQWINGLYFENASSHVNWDFLIHCQKK